jgi:RNA polymerase sigma-70 factor (ECF subfamily)
MSVDVVTNPDDWVDRHGGNLHRYALLRLRSPDLAADVIQETFLEAVRARNHFSRRSSKCTGLVRPAEENLFPKGQPRS